VRSSAEDARKERDVGFARGRFKRGFPERGGFKYSNEKPGRARRKTCLDQYKANKSTNANGGLKWLQKGGGYYSQCAKKLKGAA
jgi:hypothetical protein